MFWFIYLHSVRVKIVTTYGWSYVQATGEVSWIHGYQCTSWYTEKMYYFSYIFEYKSAVDL